MREGEERGLAVWLKECLGSVEVYLRELKVVVEAELVENLVFCLHDQKGIRRFAGVISQIKLLKFCSLLMECPEFSSAPEATKSASYVFLPSIKYFIIQLYGVLGFCS